MSLFGRSKPEYYRIDFTNFSFQGEFIETNTDIIISNLLKDTLEFGVSQKNTFIPIFPHYIEEQAYIKGFSLFDVCFETLKRGSFRFTFLEKTQGGFVEHIEHEERYRFIESISPFSKERKPLSHLIAIPLSVFYYTVRNLLIKQEVFTNKFILYIDGMRNYGSDSSPSHIDAFQDHLKESIQRIIDKRNNVLVMDSKDRVDTPSLFDSTMIDTIQFVYQEISRILGIPLTRLTGKSPDGMNATGTSDDENYRKTMRGLLDGLIIPIITSFDSTFQEEHNVDIQTINQSLSALSSLDLIEILTTSEKQAIKRRIFDELGLIPEESS